MHRIQQYGVRNDTLRKPLVKMYGIVKKSYNLLQNAPLSVSGFRMAKKLIRTEYLTNRIKSNLSYFVKIDC